MSPEIATSDKRSEDFFIEDPEVLKDVCRQNYIWIRGVIERFQDRQLVFFDKGTAVMEQNEGLKDVSILSEFTISNKGLSDAKASDYRVRIEGGDDKITHIILDGE